MSVSASSTSAIERCGSLSSIAHDFQSLCPAGRGRKTRRWPLRPSRRFVPPTAAALLLGVRSSRHLRLALAARGGRLVPDEAVARVTLTAAASHDLVATDRVAVKPGADHV